MHGTATDEWTGLVAKDTAASDQRERMNRTAKEARDAVRMQELVCCSDAQSFQRDLSAADVKRPV
eukprot:CAMPEP_0177745866 /NCGR_PEP_ID=MMETSP0484_2-20121128/30546_1 /TAXON_ID=354590 /ORGANISM="Rhodomonas lens, Strain RHODO" /LENGTH=64 /DNA_ID=CAMNT_0019260541 /DNA_START=630 /DNA_END=821 /DNA_ORIENTATION=-